MNNSILLHTLISFFAGGIFITFLTLIAEKSSEKTAGIVLMFPSTLMLGFFFLGWTTSSQTVSQIAPSTLIPLGVGISASTIYIYVSIFIGRYIKDRLKQITATLVVSTILWMILAFPFAVIHIHSIIAGTAGYLLFVVASHFLLNINKAPIKLKPVRYTSFQILLRAVFVGLTISTVVILSSVLNPFWGGVFTMFPSVTFSSLIIFHYYYNPEQLFYFMKKAPIGSLSLYVYDISAMVLFKKIGFIAGSLMCVAISLIVSWTLSKL